MIYLLYGSESFLVNKEINKILEENKIDKININTYDLNNDLLTTIIEDAETISLFSDNKAIIIYNSYIFSGKKNTIEQNIDILEQYLNNHNPNTVLIFVLLADKLDERKKIVKIIKQKHVAKLLNNNFNINTIVKDMFLNYNISNETINLLIDRVGKNLSILDQEINKIMIYKDTDLKITNEDIINLTTKNIEADIFGLVEAIIKKNKKKALDIYNELLKNNEEPIKIIITLANQFRIIYQTKEMYKKGYTEHDIATTLAIHPYRIKLALNSSREYDSKLLLKYLNELSNLDIGIKTGTINKEIGLELFIINL